MTHGIRPTCIGDLVVKVATLGRARLDDLYATTRTPWSADVRICRIAGVACSYTHAPTYMSLTVTTIANSALPLVLAACRAMLLCLAKGILLTFLASFWVLDWNGDGAKVGQAGRAARASH